MQMWKPSRAMPAVATQPQPPSNLSLLGSQPAMAKRVSASVMMVPATTPLVKLGCAADPLKATAAMGKLCLQDTTKSSWMTRRIRMTWMPLQMDCDQPFWQSNRSNSF